MQRLRQLVSLTYAQKLSLVAAIPLVVAVAALAMLVTYEARATAEREIEALERSLEDIKARFESSHQRKRKQVSRKLTS